MCLQMSHIDAWKENVKIAWTLVEAVRVEAVRVEALVGMNEVGLNPLIYPKLFSCVG